jgi:hypothetical protein
MAQACSLSPMHCTLARTRFSNASQESPPFNSYFSRAPSAKLAQLSVVRAICEENPKAGQDVTILEAKLHKARPPTIQLPRHLPGHNLDFIYTGQVCEQIVKNFALLDDEEVGDGTLIVLEVYILADHLCMDVFAN